MAEKAIHIKFLYKQKFLWFCEVTFKFHIA